jgi:predicted RND superfamily exporter protein
MSTTTDRSPDTTRRPLLSWVARHRRITLALVVVLTALAVVPAGNRSAEEADFSPHGEVFATGDLIEERFGDDTGVDTAVFIVSGDEVLDRAVLTRLNVAADELRADPQFAEHLAVAVDLGLGEPVDGVFSVAGALDEHLVATGAGPLTSADSTAVDAALATLLLPGAPTAGLRDTLSHQAIAPAVDGDRWSSPALMATVAYNPTTFEVDPTASPEVQADERELAIEGWLRDVQTHLRDQLAGGEGGGVDVVVHGVVIDDALTGEEEGNRTAPFILGAVIVVVALVGLMLRSYWSSALVAAGLGATMIWLAAIINTIGVKDSMLVTFIVPIATIAFGVDFFVHGYGRVREELASGTPAERAWPLGLGAVMGALTLALVSSAAAFAANAVSGIEAIIGFGISAAVALAVAYVLLGILVPLFVTALEGDRWTRVAQDANRPARSLATRSGAVVAFVAMTIVGGSAVTMAVMMPTVGAVALALFAAVFIVVPLAVRRRRDRRHADGATPVVGRSTPAPSSSFSPDRHQRRSWAGAFTGAMARLRWVVLPLAAVLMVVGAVAGSRVESRFSVNDFFSADSDLVAGLDLLSEHYNDSLGRPGVLYIEGDLANPEVVAGVAEAQTRLAEAATPLARTEDGQLVNFPDVVDIASATVASPLATGVVVAATGVIVTDTNSDGLPDTAEQMAAVFETALSEGVTGADGTPVLLAEDVAGVLWTDGDSWATLVTVGIPTMMDAGIIDGARGALDEAGESLLAGPAGGSITVASVAGEAIEDQAGQDAFTRSMLLALPIALAAGLAAASLFLRSIRFGAIAVLPVLGVVVGLLAFMHLAGFAINPVTATIAAIAVGVGIDFGTHFTIRFREELEGTDSAVAAVERTGAGTGRALVMSALTSVLGFGVMAFAPMPIFAAFGMLIAVMIALSLLVSLVALPGLLVLVAAPATTPAPTPVPVRVVPARTERERELEPVGPRV